MKEKEMKEETTVIFIDEGTIDLEELNLILCQDLVQIKMRSSAC